MATLDGQLQMQLRNIDAPGALDEVRSRAREIWQERDKGFPAFCRQRFEDGTWEARYATMMLAAKELGFVAA